jgi:MFS family permease
MLVSVQLRSFGLAYSTIGLMSTAAVLLSSLPQVLFGHMIDRYGRRATLIKASILARTFFLLMVALSSDPLALAFWYVAASLPLSVFMPSIQSFVAIRSAPRAMGASMGLYRLGGSAGWAVMCLVAGLVASLSSSYALAFALGALLSFAALLVSLSLADSEPPAPPATAPEPGRSPAVPAEGGMFYASLFLGSLGIGATASFLTILLSELGGDPVVMGAVLAAGAAAEVPAMYFGGRMADEHGPLWVLSAGMAGMAISYLFYGWVAVPAAFVVVQVARGLFYGLFTVSGMAMSSSLGGVERGGLHAGLYNLIGTLGSSSGPSLAGFVSDRFGLRSMFSLSSLVSLLGASLAGSAALMSMGPASKGSDRSGQRPNSSLAATLGPSDRPFCSSPQGPRGKPCPRALS